MKVLVVAAHPDDEVLGAGGTMAGHAENWDDIHTLIMTEGITGRGYTEGLKELKRAAYRANNYLGASLDILLFPDNRMDSLDLLDIVQAIEKEVEQFKPDIIYTHHKNDLNIDHRITYQAVITACRPLPGSTVKKILCFEIPSSTEWGAGFNPNYFIEINMERKLKALKAYESEMRDYPHPRSYRAVEHLAGWRGATVGMEAAEAFEVERIIR